MILLTLVTWELGSCPQPCGKKHISEEEAKGHLLLVFSRSDVSDSLRPHGL